MGAPSQSPGRDTGQARLAASGALTQQLAQVTGLLVLLAIVTALARDLSLAELGTYGLTATLAVYLLVIKNSISSSGLRAMTRGRGTSASRWPRSPPPPCSTPAPRWPPGC